MLELALDGEPELESAWQPVFDLADGRSATVLAVGVPVMPRARRWLTRLNRGGQQPA